VGFINPNETGILERAAKFALRFSVIYDPRTKTFKGEAAGVEKATAALAAWQEKKDDRLRHERRQESW
jgi:hypothetical protein